GGASGESVRVRYQIRRNRFRVHLVAEQNKEKNLDQICVSSIESMLNICPH
ncbi:hypothetical protein GOODEAATRI_032726, partial [Goodea atripinnis]